MRPAHRVPGEPRTHAPIYLGHWGQTIRYEHLRVNGWEPVRTFSMVNRCGHGQEFVSVPEADGYWRLVPVGGNQSAPHRRLLFRYRMIVEAMVALEASINSLAAKQEN